MFFLLLLILFLLNFWGDEQLQCMLKKDIFIKILLFLLIIGFCASLVGPRLYKSQRPVDLSHDEIEQSPVAEVAINEEITQVNPRYNETKTITNVESVPPGMRAIHTPFGDRLVSENKAEIFRESSDKKSMFAQPEKPLPKTSYKIPLGTEPSDLSAINAPSELTNREKYAHIEGVCSQFDVFDVKVYATVGIPW